MNRTSKILAGLTVAAALTVLLIGTVLASGMYATSGAVAAAPAIEQSAAGGCAKMNPGDVQFFTVTEDGEVDEFVESLPSGATEIYAAFTYNCVPKNTVIVTVWDLDGETIATRKESLKVSSAEGAYVDQLRKEDESALWDGEYTVSFYNNKTLLTSGTIVLGGDTGDDRSSDGEQLSVEGVITDKRTKRPIEGATILVLSPSTTIKEWLDNDGPEDEVFAITKTDAYGEFALDQYLERNVAYPFIIGAEGYQYIFEEAVMFDDEAPNPLVLNIQMSKAK